MDVGCNDLVTVESETDDVLVLSSQMVTNDYKYNKTLKAKMWDEVSLKTALYYKLAHSYIYQLKQQSIKPTNNRLTLPSKPIKQDVPV